MDTMADGDTYRLMLQEIRGSLVDMVCICIYIYVYKVRYHQISYIYPLFLASPDFSSPFVARNMLYKLVEVAPTFKPKPWRLSSSPGKMEVDHPLVFLPFRELPNSRHLFQVARNDFTLP